MVLKLRQFWFVTLALATTLCFIFNQSKCWHRLKSTIGTASPSLSANESHRLKILIWTTPRTSKKDFYLLEMNTCKFKCSFTMDKRLVHTVDAVVSHIRDIGRPMPKQLKLNQLRVLLSREPPSILFPKPRDSPNVFNWTFTYRLDSDVPIKWGKHRLKPNVTETCPSSANFSSESHFQDYQTQHLPPGRNKLVAWVVSNCKTHSKREKYVSELQKYIPVDVYGSCGSLKCNQSRQTRCKTDVCESCYVQLAKTYKFILAFENSMCVDYVTEKLFDALAFTDLVPVVYGAVNYSKFAPPLSFIDTSEFSTVRDLGDYLFYLDKNPREYLKYLLWKERYRIVASLNRWCDLCKKMVQVSVLDEWGNQIINPQYSKYYTNITKWWWFAPANEHIQRGKETPICRKPKQTFSSSRDIYMIKKQPMK